MCVQYIYTIPPFYSQGCRILLRQGTDDVRHTAAGDPGGGGGGEPLQPGHSLLLIRRVGTRHMLGHAIYWSQSCAGLTLGGSSTITGDKYAHNVGGAKEKRQCQHISAYAME